MLNAENISLHIDGKCILNDVDFAINAGECVGIIGPNGAGKTSLMRAIMAMTQGATGQCNLWKLSSKKRAQYVGWLAQERSVSWDTNVEEIIKIGRLPWKSFAGRAHASDKSAIEAAISKLGLTSFLERQFQDLSGGERARVLIARLLAQDTPTMFADEPIAALDPANQLQAMSIFRSLADEGRAVALSIHDLSLAARYCTRLVLMNKGNVVAVGAPEEVLSTENLNHVFGIKAFKLQTEYGLVIQPIEEVEKAHDQG